jgi:O-methyltransferase involved in polyketide biosynthesis
MAKIKLQSENVVAETLLIALYARALEAQQPAPLIRDDTAVALVERIDYDFAASKLSRLDQVTAIMRVREFDRRTRDFLGRHPEAVVVHIGCGLDTRFERLDNGRLTWYDLDLPEVIDLRRKLIRAEAGRYHLLDRSVLDPAWMEVVAAHRPQPFLFLAEGVFPYFDASQVKALVQKLHAAFPGAELVFDAHTPWVIRSDNLQLLFSGVEARLHFGLRHGRDVEAWGDGIRMLEEWFYFGTDEPRLRPYRWMYKIGFLRKSTGIFHYRLGG